MSSQEFAKSKVFNFNKSIEYSSGAIVSKTMVKKPTGTITIFAFDAGQGLSEHTASFDALIQIIDGIGEIIIDGNPYTLETGESIVMPANIPHAVNANVKFKMLLTMIKE